MVAIYGTFLHFVQELVGRDIVYTFLASLAEFLIECLLGIVPGGDILASIIVQTHGRIKRMLHDNNRHVGMSVTYNTEEGLAALIDTVSASIRGIVQNIESRFLDGCHEPGDIQVEESITAETEIYDLDIEGSLQQ